MAYFICQRIDHQYFVSRKRGNSLVDCLIYSCQFSLRIPITRVLLIMQLSLIVLPFFDLRVNKGRLIYVSINSGKASMHIKLES